MDATFEIVRDKLRLVTSVSAAKCSHKERLLRVLLRILDEALKGIVDLMRADAVSYRRDGVTLSLGTLCNTYLRTELRDSSLLSLLPKTNTSSFARVFTFTGVIRSS